MIGVVCARGVGGLCVWGCVGVPVCVGGGGGDGEGGTGENGCEGLCGFFVCLQDGGVRVYKYVGS